jgi:hypothetical protein
MTRAEKNEEIARLLAQVVALRAALAAPQEPREGVTRFGKAGDEEPAPATASEWLHLTGMLWRSDSGRAFMRKALDMTPVEEFRGALESIACNAADLATARNVARSALGMAVSPPAPKETKP